MQNLIDCDPSTQGTSDEMREMRSRTRVLPSVSTLTKKLEVLEQSVSPVPNRASKRTTTPKLQADLY